MFSTGYFMGLFIGPVIAGNIAEKYVDVLIELLV